MKRRSLLERFIGVKTCADCGVDVCPDGYGEGLWLDKEGRSWHPKGGQRELHHPHGSNLR